MSKVVTISEGSSSKITPVRSPSLLPHDLHGESQIHLARLDHDVESTSSQKHNLQQQQQQEQESQVQQGSVSQGGSPGSARSQWPRIASVYYSIWTAGYNDACLGALIPYLQTYYNIGTAFVAFVYIANFVGFITAAFVNAYLTGKIGIGGVLVVGAFSQMLSYCFYVWAPPYPLFVIMFYFAGFGVALQDAQSNSWTASLDNGARWLGYLHAAYGLGGFVAPFIATTVAVHTSHFLYFYFTAIFFGVINVVLLAFTFKASLFKPYNQGRSQSGEANYIRDSLRLKSVWLFAVFLFFYVGVEVASGGWVVEFMIKIKNAEPEPAGYTASGFWAGLTLGRLALADITVKLGEKMMVYVYILITFALEMIVWFVPSFVGSAVSMAFIGFFIGPMFPTAISLLSKLLPRYLHISSIGFVATFGQAGSAAFPFLTGLIASRSSVLVLQPVIVGLLVAMTIIWFLTPSVNRRSE